MGSRTEWGEGVKERVHRLKYLDIVMLYSDGYSDNVFPKSYTRCLEALMNWETRHIDDFSGAADCQAKFAYTLSKQTKYVSPFA